MVWGLFGPLAASRSAEAAPDAARMRRVCLRAVGCAGVAFGVDGVRLTVPMWVYVAIGRSAVGRTQGVVGSAVCVWWGLVLPSAHRAIAAERWVPFLSPRSVVGAC